MGNAKRRFFYGPGINNFDMTLAKDLRITESKSMEFRLEGFNVFNHSQFYGPATVDGEINDSNFGQIIGAAPPRLIQVAAKLGSEYVPEARGERGETRRESHLFDNLYLSQGRGHKNSMKLALVRVFICSLSCHRPCPSMHRGTTRFRSIDRHRRARPDDGRASQQLHV